MNPVFSESLPEPDKSREFMQRPWLWQNMLLPLKRPTGKPGTFPECGFLVAPGTPDDLGTQPKVYLGVIFLAAEALKQPPLVYANFDAVVADGWRVD